MMEMAPELSELQKPHTDLKLRAWAAVQWCIAEYNTVQWSEQRGKNLWSFRSLHELCVKILTATVTMLYIQYNVYGHFM